MKFRPLHYRVVIERIDAEAKTAGGIIIPDTAQEKPQQGKVSAVGPGGRDESGKLVPIDVEVGDRILVLVQLAGGNDGLNSIVPYATARKIGWTDVDFLGSAASYDLFVAAAQGGVTEGLYAMGLTDMPYRDTLSPAAQAWFDRYLK